MSFRSLIEANEWRPIRGCPGRFVLASGPSDRPPHEFCGVRAEQVSTHHASGARDPVYVLAFAGGGLISYRRSDGTFVHTIGDDDGFTRKLKQLCI